MKFDYDGYFSTIECDIYSEDKKYFIVKQGDFLFKLFKDKIRNNKASPTVSNCLDKVEYFKHIMKSHPKKKLSFDKFVFNGIKTPSVVTCSEHGDFLADPYRLINIRSGCAKCYNKYEKIKVKRKTRDQFIADSKAKFGETYDYSLVVYVNTMTKVKLICPIHGIFEQTPNEHLQSITGCGSCGKELSSGYSASDYSAICSNGSSLYVLKLKYNDSEFYKVGISKEVMKRIKSFKRKGIQLVGGYSYWFDDSEYVWYLEKEIHSLLNQYKYKPEVKFGGCTECFKCDNIDFVYDYINLIRSGFCAEREVF